DATASNPPAAAAECPVIDLMLLAGTRYAASPNASLIAAGSVLSLYGVPVPCAFSHDTSSGAMPADFSARDIESDCPSAPAPRRPPGRMTSRGRVTPPR